MENNSMLSIDPVEAALAVVGVEPILSREVEKIRLTEVKEMNSLASHVYTEAKNVVKGETSSVPLTAVNYKKMLKLLTDEYDASQLQDMVAQFPTALHEISGDFLIKAQDLIKLLRGLFPLAVKQTLLGPENILPPALAVRKFATLLDVLDNPMRVFAHISCGSLLKSQADVLKEVYPTFSAAVTAAFTDAGTNAKATKKSFQLSPRVTMGYSKWQGLPAVNPRLSSRLQKNFKNANEEKAKPQTEASGEANSVISKEAMTNTQRGLFPQMQAQGR